MPRMILVAFPALEETASHAKGPVGQDDTLVPDLGLALPTWQAWRVAPFVTVALLRIYRKAHVRSGRLILA